MTKNSRIIITKQISMWYRQFQSPKCDRNFHKFDGNFRSLIAKFTNSLICSHSLKCDCKFYKFDAKFQEKIDNNVTVNLEILQSHFKI